MKRLKQSICLILPMLLTAQAATAQCNSYMMRIVNYTDKICRLTAEDLTTGGMYEPLYRQSQALYVAPQIGPNPIIKPDEEVIFAIAHKFWSSSGVDLTYECDGQTVSIKTHLTNDSFIMAGTLSASVENTSSDIQGDYRILTQPSCLNDTYAMVNWNIRKH